MAVFKGLCTDGYKFAFGIGGAAALGKPLDFRGPEQVLLPPAGALDDRLERLIGYDGDAAGKGFIGVDVLEAVPHSNFGLIGEIEQLLQDFLLNLSRVFKKEFNLVIPLLKEPGSYGIKQRDRHFWYL